MIRRDVIAFIVVGVFMWLSSVAYAASGIKKIVHPDGRVEFTNVDGANSRVINTKERPALSKIYKFRQEDGITTYSDSNPGEGFAIEVYKVSCFACSSNSKVNWHKTRLFKSNYAKQILASAQHYKVDPALVKAVIHAESAFNPKAKSSQGAMGLMQLMPATAEELGVLNAYDVAMNIDGGTKYLAQMLKRFDGDVELATAAYNAGPNAVKKHGGIPPYRETKNYVERVGILYSRYQKITSALPADKNSVVALEAE